MANNNSYSNDRPPVGVAVGTAASDLEYATDPASGSFFQKLQDYKKHEDLKQMLDMNKDSVKLEAMKRIIGMVAKGRDTSNLFPAVVKNVVSKNIEVKKLVYVYLVRYAEEQQDLALLSISTFQRALKDPNQLIRASALRVLSSIRVSVIVPIVMLAIRDSASDMSPYVRKTAAHAIPKLHSLDPEQKEELVHVIEKLLSDKTTLVVGSAVMAFEEVCPERIDLIHKNYRKLCNLLVDVDEWGQVIIINMLTRYARTQFTDPNLQESGDESEEKFFYDDDDNDKNNKNKSKKTPHSLDPDHRLLLRNARPLLQSRNASVVMSVAQLYHHLAPRNEVGIVAKSLVRLLRSHREVQSVVLNCIASISIERKGMFESYLKSFFVRTSDPTHIKLLKLEILTNLATETSISFILREFQTYISSTDKEFVAAAIQAIGRCASNIKEVTDSCLSGLVSMLSNRDEAVVAESVVVIKKLLQSQPFRHKDIISHMARLFDSITVPQARASILWLIGEYSKLVPTIAPDVLRKVAKTFTSEEVIVKLQALNVAVKLCLTNPQQTQILCQYIFSLARYDQNYDIRDRSRFLRQFIFPSNGETKLSRHAADIFLATKPAPLLQSKFKDREQLQLGSLSHYINTRAAGYHDLPDFPTDPSDPSVRNVPDSTTTPKPEVIITKSHVTKKKKKTSFYSDSDSSQDSDCHPEESDDESSEASSESEDSDSEDTDSESSEITPQLEDANGNRKDINIKGKTENDDSEEDNDENDEDDSSSSLSSCSSSSSETARTVTKAVVLTSGMKTNNKHTANIASTKENKPKSNLDLLLDLDDVPPVNISTPVITPSLGGFLTPLNATPTFQSIVTSTVQTVSPSFIPVKTIQLLNKITGSGLSVTGRFTRSPHLYSPVMTSIELLFTNHSPEPITELQVGSKNLGSNMEIHDFAPVSLLSPGSTAIGTIGVAWNDSTQPVTFQLIWEEGNAQVTIRAPVGELLKPVTMPEHLFLSEQGKLKGMNEHTAQLNTVVRDNKVITQKVVETANVSSVPSTDPQYLRFGAQTVSSKSLVLLTINRLQQSVELTVNCEKMVIGSMLLNEVKTALQNI
ncbi:adaptor related protein complex 3 subunit ruby [Lycorma delicatula]|uniref:adaptor related protein complex 3 subunit ruby n=1 Tax=Lycorma delicatula TaxID=130591 RepID=UPI003F51969F